MRRSALIFCSAITIALLLQVSVSWAQLAPPNEAGVTMGHVQLNVRDIEASKKFYLQLGGTPVKVGKIEGIKYPGVLFLFTKADPKGDMEGSTVNHIGFTVKDGVALFAKMKAQGVKTASNGVDAQGRVYGGYIYSPDGVKLRASIINRPTLAVPLQFDQVHFFVADPGPNGGPGWSDLQKWYANMFGVKIQRAELSGPAPGNLASAPMAQSNVSGTNFSGYSKAGM